jgi:hypothetical protein
MAAAETNRSGTPEPPLTDWTVRLVTAPAVSPVWVGFGIAVAVTGLSQGVRLFFYPADARLDVAALGLLADPYFWLDILNAVLLAYLLVALVFLRRWRLDDLRALRPVLAVDDAEFQRLVESALCVPPAQLAVCGAAGALVMGSLPFVDPTFWGGGPPPALTEPLLWLLVLRSAATGWVSGHAVASELRFTRTLARLGQRHLRVDLLDLDALSPFARASQRGALCWVLGSSLVSLFWLGPAAGSANAVIVPLILLLVLLSFFFSILGAHRSIVAAKREALAALEVRIRRGAPALVAGQPAEAGLADAIAYHGFVANLREWPFGALVVVRWGVIAGVGVASWLGGGLAEQLLERAIG